MKILIAGDFCDIYKTSEIISNNLYNELFEIISDDVKSADYSFVNFEFPIVLNNEAPIHKCGPNLKGQLASVDAIKYAGFTCCTLANNHILDYGEKCLIDTINSIERAGIKTVGAGADLADASKTLYLEKEGKILAVINCCEHEFTIATETTAGANPLNPIQQYYKILEARQRADYVLVIVHGGHEHYQLPSPRMKETYRFFVDAGADAVVNHHQHCYSGYEIYNDKPIFYGIGNFLFDWKNKRESTWYEGYMVNLIFGSDHVDFNIIPYVQCLDNNGVSLITNEESLKKFRHSIFKLNSIISDDCKLRQSHEEWMSKSSKYYMLALEPYRGRFFSALYMRNILPSCIVKSKRLQILNYIQCESHLDRLRYVISKKLK